MLHISTNATFMDIGAFRNATSFRIETYNILDEETFTEYYKNLEKT